MKKITLMRGIMIFQNNIITYGVEIYLFIVLLIIMDINHEQNVSIITSLLMIYIVCQYIILAI